MRVHKLQAGNMELEHPFFLGIFRYLTGHECRISQGKYPPVHGLDIRVYQVRIGYHSLFFLNIHAAVIRIPLSRQNDGVKDDPRLYDILLIHQLPGPYGHIEEYPGQDQRNDQAC